jgi:beta-lactam-binding protein with PASTA domain/tRNA A-37 threonylcarbamoyl transferase component Bud32
VERSAVADPLVGHLLDQRYRVESKIARGGMATVYQATDLRLDRRVALKVMPHALADDDEFAQRFVREARAAARLTHPNVVAVYDQGDDNGVLFLTMEYVEGRHTLRDVIRDEAPLTPTRALSILEEILRALAAAHESGIIHRDIKPENVLISPRGQVKVADFGLARAISSSTSATATGGVLMGTVSYLPPELVVDGTADARSDVYSVGVVLFEMLTGTKPHVGESPIQVAYRHVHDDVAPPSRLVPGIPPYLAAFVARATSRQRDLRPADAHVMLQQLRRVRHALDHGVTDDQELTDDLTPTVAVSAGTFAPVGGSTDDVFDQEAFGPEARTMSVGAPATRPETTLEEPARDAAALRYAPPASPPSVGGPRRRRRRAGWVAFLVVILLAATAALAGWYYGAGRYQNTPNVIGMTQAAAAAKLEASHLSLEVTGTSYSENVPAGELISTDPGPGKNITTGGTVRAVISKGKERHDVPDVSAMTRAAAVAAVEARSLTVAAPPTRVWSNTVDAGMVVSFTPEAGTPLKRGGVVHLVVSRGPKPIPIPSFVGKDADQARNSLKALGFVVGYPLQVYNDDVAAGLVISQTPHSGTGHLGDHVRLVISKGPHLVQVPDVYHQGTAAAEQTLRDAGFRPVVKPYSPSFGLGFVEDQSPNANEMAPLGSTVTIYIV